MTPIPFEARRFRSTAAYYAHYRVPYPDALIERVSERAGLVPSDRLLDLGCGPGQLGIAFARLAKASVTAMDPEPEMLEAARSNAAEAGVRASFVQGSSYDLGQQFAPLAMTVMGRSFHWMDRPATLAALDAITAPGGSIVLFGDRHVSVTPDWHEALRKLAEHFSPERNAERERRRGPEWTPHEDILLKSAFRNLERIGIVVERSLDIDDIVGRVFSMSATSPQALGDRVAEFEQTLRRELVALSSTGTFSETVDVNGLICFRP
ncbi:class I SAM-dependent methyltransferase [Rhizobium sp. Root1220]|uniref:class I SAM-dependent methyltransferase n=1 Tax=Rhizobium sp. Root1220 TaxID=1736432 RepID=UPI0006F29105|nr:class I SAM-dependent methyltransferase [Rhizobium sp. Root1220]KQV73338.1 3-demethylubiquinone-9 3-methyltransferase [Rhizobium sp. Root1220]